MCLPSTSTDWESLWRHVRRSSHLFEPSTVESLIIRSLGFQFSRGMNSCLICDDRDYIIQLYDRWCNLSRRSLGVRSWFPWNAMNAAEAWMPIGVTLILVNIFFWMIVNLASVPDVYCTCTLILFKTLKLHEKWAPKYMQNPYKSNLGLHPAKNCWHAF